MDDDGSALRTLKTLDDEAWRAVQAGDAQAERDFVDVFGPQVYSLCARLLGTTDAEDVAQDALWKCLRAANGFDVDGGPATLRTWVMTIATRTAIDVHRRRRRWQKVLRRQNFSDVQAPLQEQGVLEHQLIEQTPELARVAVVLKHFHGLSQREIANALNIEEGTVKSRVARALSVLRKQLKEEEHD